LTIQQVLLTQRSGIAATGGTITIDGDFKIHQFTSLGTFTVNSTDYITPIEYLVVAGGGAGGISGSTNAGTGGGAGGLLNSTFIPQIQNYTITVGAGGAVRGENGSNSSIVGVVTSIGGGKGGGLGSVGSGYSGGNGGSGGGGGAVSKEGPLAAAGTGISGQGFDGSESNIVFPGSGGGAVSAGSTLGIGGSGLTTSISGVTIAYSVGGNGIAFGIGSTGTTNRGNGGSKQSGGSGIVILRYKYP
jgi:hypothetical protein